MTGIISDTSEINVDDLKLIVELAIDSAPTTRARLFRKLLDNDGQMTTGNIEVALQCSKPTALREMEILKILGICFIKQDSNGTVGEPEKVICLAGAFQWFLSDECKQIRGIPLPPRQSTMADLVY